MASKVLWSLFLITYMFGLTITLVITPILIILIVKIRVIHPTNVCVRVGIIRLTNIFI